MREGTWTRSSSSHANGNCVESQWRKATASMNGGSCVEALPQGTTWAKASLSFANGNCVQAAPVGTVFRKAQASSPAAQCVEATDAVFATATASGNSGNCVMIGGENGDILVKDSKDPEGPHLHYAADRWNGGRAVEFTPVSASTVPAHLVAAYVQKCDKGDKTQPAMWYAVTVPGDTSVLYYVKAEVDAFRDGISKGEFELEAAAA